MNDELGKALEFCFFPFGADDPKRANPLVPGSLRAEEFPGGLIGAKLLFLLTRELGVLSLFIRVDRLLFVASSKGLETGRVHQSLLCQLSNEVDVDDTPVAGGLAWSKTNGVAGFVEALSKAVDPAKAQCNLYGFGPGNAGLA